MTQTHLDKLAFYISAVSSPFLVPAFFIVCIVRAYTKSLRDFLLWAGVMLCFSSGIPALMVLNRYLKRQISDVHLMYKEQRGEPFTVAILSAAIGTGTLYYIEAPFALVQLGLCMVVNGVVFMAVTRFWKISMHLGTLTAAIVSVLFLFGSHLFWLALFVPPVVWARLRRQKHTLAQMLIAIILASLMTAVVFLGLPTPRNG